MNTIKALLLVPCLCVAAAAQPYEGPDARWIRTYGGDGNDYAYDICEASDGGFIVVGQTSSFGSFGAGYALRLNPDGDTLWTRRFDSICRGAQGVVRSGNNASVFLADVFGSPVLVKLDDEGDTVWVRYYGTGHDNARGLCSTLDGGFAAVIDGTDGFTLLGMDSAGFLSWTNGYNPIGVDAVESIRPTTDGGFIVGAACGITGSLDLYVVRTDSIGDSELHPLDWTESLNLVRLGGWQEGDGYGLEGSPVFGRV